MNVFVIGGRGFIGSAFARWCDRHGVTHQVIGRDDLDAYAGQYCDVLINASGNSSKVLARRDPQADFERSFLSVRALVGRFPCDVWVQISSCDVYDNVSDPARNTEDADLTGGCASHYGFHKYLAEQYVRHYANKWLILRLGGCVGPNLRKNSIYDILNSRPVWVRPDSRLQYMHADDVARCTFELLGGGHTASVFNVCGTGTVSIGECIEWTGQVVRLAGEPQKLPRVVYDINTDRVRTICEIPESRTVVRDFIQANIAETAACGTA
jgi:nucleoside-diphosphate-sugar epimerase